MGVVSFLFPCTRAAAARCIGAALGALALGLPLAAPAQVLEQLIATALATHPSTQSQRALVASAEAGLDSARWQFYPTPSVSLENAGASATDPLYQGDKQVATLRLQQPLYTGGRLSAGADKAQANLDQSQATQDDTRQQLALRVVQAYGDWLGAHLKAQANEKSEQTHTRLRDQVQRRIDEGVSADSDLVLALGRLDAIRADVTAARAQRDSNGVRIDASSLALNGAKLSDAAGNAAVLSHAGVADNASYAVLDITAPLASGATAYVSNIGNAVVKSTEVGTAYLVRNTLEVSQLGDITGADNAQWNRGDIITANTYTALSVAGLEAGVYKAYTPDASGNLSAVSDYTTLVSNTTTTAFDLGSSNLIAPLEADGKWYAFWDLNNSGTATSADKTADHNTDLDNVFKFSSDFTTIKPGWTTGTAAADTTDTYRFATLDGVKLALPTSLELSAIFTSAGGVPTDWMGASGIFGISPADYNTSTQPTSGTINNYHMDVRLTNGEVSAYVDSTNAYVALQIL